MNRAWTGTVSDRPFAGQDQYAWISDNRSISELNAAMSDSHNFAAQTFNSNGFKIQSVFRFQTIDGASRNVTRR